MSSCKFTFVIFCSYCESNKPISCFTQYYTEPFVAMKSSVKNFAGFDTQYTPAKNLHQIQAHMTFTKGEQCRDSVAYSQWHGLEKA